MKPTFWLMWLAAGLTACGGGGPGNQGSEEQVGSFTIKLVPAYEGNPAYTAVLGVVFDGPTPSPVQWVEKTRSGACRLLTPRVPHCDPACTGGSICVDENVCRPYPNPVTMGTVQVQGLKTSDGRTAFSMDPIAKNYQPVGVSFQYPPFAEGDAVTVAAAGEGTVPAFSLEAQGIRPLEILNPTITLEDGKAVGLQWNTPGLPGISTVYIKLDISHHGGSRGLLECETADSGSLELEAAMLDQLKALGVAGFPTIMVTRRSVGSARIPYGRVDLIVASIIEKEVFIPGLVSCNEDGDCPAGQTCQPDLTCR